MFRHSSAWPGDFRQQGYWLSIVLAIGGFNLLSSYVWQKPWAAMRNELAASATTAGFLILM